LPRCESPSGWLPAQRCMAALASLKTCQRGRGLSPFISARPHCHRGFAARRLTHLEAHPRVASVGALQSNSAVAIVVQARAALFPRRRRPADHAANGRKKKLRSLLLGASGIVSYRSWWPGARCQVMGDTWRQRPGHFYSPVFNHRRVREQPPIQRSVAGSREPTSFRAARTVLRAHSRSCLHSSTARGSEIQQKRPSETRR
jgi:hypothetical protein